MSSESISITKSDKIALGLIGGAFILCLVTGTLMEWLSLLFVLSGPWIIWRLRKVGLNPWLTGFGWAFTFIFIMLMNSPKHAPQVAVAAKPLIPVAENRPFTDKDFIFDAKALPEKYKDVVVAGVNKIRAEDSRCHDHISPASVSLAASKSKPNKPVFFVTCGSGGANLVNVYFSPDDIKTKTFAAPRYYADAEGMGRTLCDNFIKSAANFPETVDMKWGAKINRLVDGRTIINREFTSKNAYGVPRRYVAHCTFGESGMTDGEIEEVVR